jgi:hypothetical protein
MSNGNTSISVTFDGPPDMSSAATLSNYVVPGLALTGTPQLAGMTVSMTTASQTVGRVYSLTVSNVYRDTTFAPLTNATASFTGR